MDLLLLAAGVITALPLIWFAEGARRLRLATMGFLQYLAPTGQLLLAVFFFGEPFTRDHAISFGLIWVALALYTFDTARSMRRDAEVKSTTTWEMSLARHQDTNPENQRHRRRIHGSGRRSGCSLWLPQRGVREVRDHRPVRSEQPVGRPPRKKRPWTWSRRAG